MTTAPYVYLDTCLISGLVRADLPQIEYSSLLELLKLQKNGTIRLVTSPVANDELKKIPKEYREKHEIIYNLLTDVPIHRWGSITGLSPIGIPGFGHRRLNKDYLKLQNILPDIEDAKHIYQAICNSVDVFLTADYRTIVSKRSPIEASFTIRIRSPNEFANECGINRNSVGE